MQVILIDDVTELGNQGDVVKVADGYARNFLIPGKKAVIATPGALQDLDRRRARIQAQLEKRHAENQAKAEKINAIGTLKLEANAGEDGRLFGTITPKRLSEILTEQTGLSVERKDISADKPLNRIGEYTISVRFSARVSGSFQVQITGIIPEELQALPEADTAGEAHFADNFQVDDEDA